MSSARDVLLIARFELLRSVRDWFATALFVLYTLLMAGITYGFTRFLLSLENGLAEAMGVPAVQKPGAMIATLSRDSAELRSALDEFMGDGALTQAWLDMDLPILVIVHLLAGVFVLPFLAAFTSAECIAVDLKSRGARYECLRVGRVEFVYGRFLGQVSLMVMGALLSAMGTWFVATFAMVDTNPVDVAYRLLWITPRLLVAGVPFVGLGVACSQMVDSPNLARVLGAFAAVGSWIVYGTAHAKLRIAERMEADATAMLWDAVLQMMPQYWLDGMVAFGPELWRSTGVLLVMGVVYVAFGLPVFLRRDL